MSLPAKRPDDIAESFVIEFDYPIGMFRIGRSRSDILSPPHDLAEGQIGTSSLLRKDAEAQQG
jgi:hypothetical protein